MSDADRPKIRLVVTLKDEPTPQLAPVEQLQEWLTDMLRWRCADLGYRVDVDGSLTMSDHEENDE